MRCEVSPPDVLGERLAAGVQLAAERTLVILLLELRVSRVLLLVHRQVGVCGVALETDVTLEGLLARVHPGVTLVLPLERRIHIMNNNEYIITT